MAVFKEAGDMDKYILAEEIIMEEEEDLIIEKEHLKEIQDMYTYRY